MCMSRCTYSCEVHDRGIVAAAMNAQVLILPEVMIGDVEGWRLVMFPTHHPEMGQFPQKRDVATPATWHRLEKGP